MFCREFNLERAETYAELIKRSDIDAIYIPQPPALHYQYAKMALEAGKHVLVEKPATIRYEQTKELVYLARDRGLALHENYMFQYHRQLEVIRKLISDGIIGEIRLLRGAFGFPLREADDFRYVKRLGGGALLDAGGYTIKLATILLGDSIKIDSAHMNNVEGYEVDMYGSICMSNDEGTVFHAAYGMNNSYQCKLEVWGSTGMIASERIFTAPDSYEVILYVENKNGKKEIKVEPDSHFKKSIECFVREISDEVKREQMYDAIEKQAVLVDEVKKSAGLGGVL